MHERTTYKESTAEVQASPQKMNMEVRVLCFFEMYPMIPVAMSTAPTQMPLPIVGQMEFSCQAEPSCGVTPADKSATLKTNMQMPSRMRIMPKMEPMELRPQDGITLVS